MMTNPYLNMTREEVAEEVRRLQASGHSMKTQDLDNALYRRIRALYGSYKDAKKALGIEIERKPGSGGSNKRSLEGVLAELREALPNITNRADYYLQCGPLASYSYRHYGDSYAIFDLIGAEKPPVKAYESDVRRAGLVADGCKVAQENGDKAPSTAREAKEKALLAIAKGTPPVFRELCAVIPGLQRLVMRVFKSYENFLVYCDICPLSRRPQPAPRYRADHNTADGVRREIIRMWYIDAPLNYMAVVRRRQSLVLGANAHIGSWRKAVESAGINYDSVCKMDNILSECGKQFESTFAELLTELGYVFDREGELTAEAFGDFTIRPDFILPNYRFIDCKLSEWTDVSEMVKRYYGESPNGLTVVYLRGKKTRRERGDKRRYEHISVYEFVRQLPEERRGHYCEILAEIERKANEGAVAS